MNKFETTTSVSNIVKMDTIRMPIGDVQDPENNTTASAGKYLKISDKYLNRQGLFVQGKAHEPSDISNETFMIPAATAMRSTLRIHEGAVAPGAHKRTASVGIEQPVVAGIEDDQADVNVFEPEQALETESNSAISRIRRKLGFAGTYAFALGYDVSSKFGERAQASRQAREEKYATDDTDSRFSRAKKYVGRNGLRMAGVVLGTAAYSIALANRMEHAFASTGGGSNVDISQAHDLRLTPEIDTMASTRYIVGGHGDGTSEGIAKALDGLRGHEAAKSINVTYPAEIASPITPDTRSLDQSSQVVSDKLYNAYKTSGGSTQEWVGYSQGTQGVQDAAARVAAENGGKLPDNIKVTLIATPNAANTGIFESGYAKALSPVMNMYGANTERTVPQGATVIAFDTDFWANAGDKPLPTLISNAIGLAGDGHAVPKDGMRYTENVVDGVTYRTYHHNGTQNAALRVAEQRGLLVTREADRAASAWMPTGQVGVKDSAQFNAREAIDSTAALVDDSVRRAGIQNAPKASDIARMIPEGPVKQIYDTVMKDIPEQMAGGMSGDKTAPAPAAAPVAQFMQQPQVKQMVEQAAPAVNNIADQIQKAAPQFAPQINQFKNLFGMR